MSTTENPLAGCLLADRYRIDRLIGKGAMGAVYRAVDQRLDREVAVKVIAAATATPEMRRSRRPRCVALAGQEPPAELRCSPERALASRARGAISYA